MFHDFKEETKKLNKKTKPMRNKGNKGSFVSLWVKASKTKFSIGEPDV